MKINVNDKHSDRYSKGVGEYVREVEDSIVINAITTVSPTYYYALIDGRLFKSDTNRGLKSYLFNTREKLEKAIAEGLYYKNDIVPYIGQNCGYDTKQFYKDLTENHKVDIREFKF